MGTSSIYHSDATPPTVLKGHGTAALGPSDSSDTGSDIQGGPGLNRDDGLMEPPGTTSDPDVDGVGANAGADIGDANLDSDSDRFGTGERAQAGRDSTLPTDQLLRDENDTLIDGDSIGQDEDRIGATRDELAGGGMDDYDEDGLGNGDDAVREGTSRVASAGQDVVRERPSGTSRGDAVEPGETSHARMTNPGDRDDLPVFDRGGREDLPKGRDNTDATRR